MADNAFISNVKSLLRADEFNSELMDAIGQVYFCLFGIPIGRRLSIVTAINEIRDFIMRHREPIHKWVEQELEAKYKTPETK